MIMIKLISNLAMLLSIIIWAVLLRMYWKRDRNRWLEIDSLTDALRRSNDRVDKESQKVKQLETALLDQDKVIKAQHNEVESVKKTRYDEIRKMVSEMIAKGEEKKAAEKADEKVQSFLDSLIKEMELRNFEPVLWGKITINSKKEK